MAPVKQTASERMPQCAHRWTALFSAIVIASLAAGCTGPNSISRSHDSISVAVKFVNGSGDLLLADDRPEEASLLLGAIAGATVGRVNGTLQTVRIAKLPRIEIDLRSFSAAIAPQAATMIAAEAASGVQIAPPDTKFARASALLKSKGPRGRLTVRFINSDDSSTLTLFYFDRPCRLVGSVKDGESTYVYDVTIEKAGLSWLIFTPKDSTEYVIRAAPAAIRPSLLIRPAAP